MIAFEDMDQRLSALDRDRLWLAHESKYSESSVREALAPNSKKRSPRMQRILSETIEAEEASRKKISSMLLPSRISLECHANEFDAWCRSYKASPHATLGQWAVAALNEAAGYNAPQQMKVAEDPAPYGQPKPDPQDRAAAEEVADELAREHPPASPSKKPRS